MAPTAVAAAFRDIEGGWRNYLIYARHAAQNGDEDMTKFFKVFDALTSREKKSIYPETICDLADVAPKDLVAVVRGEYWELKRSESAMTAATYHHKVMRATAERAKRSWGTKDAELFFRVTGSLPDKHGHSITINNSPVNQVANLPLMGSGYTELDADVLESDKILQPRPSQLIEPSGPFINTTSIQDELAGDEP